MATDQRKRNAGNQSIVDIRRQLFPILWPSARQQPNQIKCTKNYAVRHRYLACKRRPRNCRQKVFKKELKRRIGLPVE